METYVTEETRRSG